MAQRLKNLPAISRAAGDSGSVPGSGRSPGEGNDNQLQYSCLESSMDRGVWWLQSRGSQRAGHDSTHTSLLTKLARVIYVYLFYIKKRENN